MQEEVSGKSHIYADPIHNGNIAILGLPSSASPTDPYYPQCTFCGKDFRENGYCIVMFVCYDRGIANVSHLLCYRNTSHNDRIA